MKGGDKAFYFLIVNIVILTTVFIAGTAYILSEIDDPKDDLANFYGGLTFFSFIWALGISAYEYRKGKQKEREESIQNRKEKKIKRQLQTWEIVSSLLDAKEMQQSYHLLSMNSSEYSNMTPEIENAPPQSLYEIRHIQDGMMTLHWTEVVFALLGPGTKAWLALNQSHEYPSYFVDIITNLDKTFASLISLLPIVESQTIDLKYAIPLKRWLELLMGRSYAGGMSGDEIHPTLLKTIWVTLTLQNLKESFETFIVMATPHCNYTSLYYKLSPDFHESIRLAYNFPRIMQDLKEICVQEAMNEYFLLKNIQKSRLEKMKFSEELLLTYNKVVEERKHVYDRTKKGKQPAERYFESHPEGSEDEK